MAIVYTVDDIRILTWEIQIARERVRVVYAELLDTDERWDVKEAFFGPVCQQKAQADRAILFPTIGE